MGPETKVFAVVIVPVFLVALDLSSDGGVLYTMGNYALSTWPAYKRSLDRNAGTTTSLDTTNMGSDVTVTEPTNTAYLDNTTGTTTARGLNVGPSNVGLLTLVSALILIAATYSLFRSNPLPTLLRAAHTAVSMGSKEEEEKDVSLPLGECYC